MENGIPKYLKRYVFTDEKIFQELKGSFVLCGKVKCSCGSENFIIYREKYQQSAEGKKAEREICELIQHYQREYKGDGTIYIASRQNKEYIIFEDKNSQKEILLIDITEQNKILSKEELGPVIVEAVCAECYKKIYIFNSAVNGYNGLLNSFKEKYKNDYSVTKKPKCRKCGSEFYKIKLHISNTGKTDLLIDQPCEHINEENWTNAFDWISIDLECSNCGKLTKRWFETETM